MAWGRVTFLLRSIQADEVDKKLVMARNVCRVGFDKGLTHAPSSFRNVEMTVKLQPADHHVLATNGLGAQGELLLGLLQLNQQFFSSAHISKFAPFLGVPVPREAAMHL
jgi:hypothetical protein